MSASMPSASATRITSSTVPRSAASSAITPSRVPEDRYFSRLQLKPPNSQPPLRPEAPNPANSFSTTATFRPGSAFFR